MKKNVRLKLNTVVEVEVDEQMDDEDIIRLAKEKLDDPYGCCFWGDLISASILEEG